MGAESARPTRGPHERAAPGKGYLLAGVEEQAFVRGVGHQGATTLHEPCNDYSISENAVTYALRPCCNLDTLGMACFAGFRPEIRNCAPVAQLDRATDYESVGREFESLRAHHEHLSAYEVFQLIEKTVVLRVQNPLFGVVF